MTDTEHQIQLDAKHRVLRSGNRWALQHRQADGTYDLQHAWDGNRRSLLQYLEQQGIVPSRQAETQLANLPEAKGFRERQ